MSIWWHLSVQPWSFKLNLFRVRYIKSGVNVGSSLLGVTYLGRIGMYVLLSSPYVWLSIVSVFIFDTYVLCTDKASI